MQCYTGFLIRVTPYRIIRVIPDFKRMSFFIISFNVLKEIERKPETFHTSEAPLTDNVNQKQIHNSSQMYV